MPRPSAKALCASALAFVAAGLLSCGSPAPNTTTPIGTPTSAAFEIEGTVRLPDAVDSSGIQVFVPGSSSLAMTDSQGDYALAGLPEGIHVVMAQKAGFKLARLGEIDASSGAVGRHFVLPDQTMEPESAAAGAIAEKLFGSIKGRIRIASEGADGDLASARVELANTAMRTLAAADGSFLLWNLTPGDYTLAVTLDGFAPFRAAVKVEASAKPTDIDVALVSGDGASVLASSGRAISGTVEMYYSDGSPAADQALATVGLRESGAPAVPVAEDGSFRIEGLAAGVYTVYALAEGYELFNEASADLTRRPSAEITLTLVSASPNPAAPGRISGSAFKDLPTAKDMGGITVALAGTSHVSITNAQGFYEMRDIPPGTYELVAQAEGFESAKVEALEVKPAEELEMEDIHLKPILDYPVVVDAEPPDGAKEVLVQYEIPIRIRFNKKMRPETLKKALSIEPRVDFAAFAGKEHRQADDDALYIVLNGAASNATAPPVKYGQNFRLTIGEAAEDYEGLHLQEPFVLHFQTGKPSVMDTLPPEGTPDAVLNPGDPLVIRFNAGIDPETLDPKDIRIRPSLPVIPTVQSTDDPATGWTSLHIQCMWKADTKYQVTLPSRIRTDSGQKVANLPFTLRFKTAESVQARGPNAINR